MTGGRGLFWTFLLFGFLLLLGAVWAADSASNISAGPPCRTLRPHADTRTAIDNGAVVTEMAPPQKPRDRSPDSPQLPVPGFPVPGFPPLAVNILGHVDIRVTHAVPHNLRPCAFAQHMAGMHGAEASKIPSIVRSGRVRISANAVRQHSRAHWISGV